MREKGAGRLIGGPPLSVLQFCAVSRYQTQPFAWKYGKMK